MGPVGDFFVGSILSDHELFFLKGMILLDHESCLVIIQLLPSDLLIIQQGAT